MDSYFPLDDATAYVDHLKQEVDYFLYFMHIYLSMNTLPEYVLSLFLRQEEAGSNSSFWLLVADTS